MYLKEKYGTNEALIKAWRDDTADIERPAIPSLEERFYAFDFDETYEREDEVVVDFLMSAASNGYNVGNFLNVDKCARAFDFYRAWHVATAKSQIYFGELIKKRYGGALAHRLVLRLVRLYEFLQRIDGGCGDRNS